MAKALRGSSFIKAVMEASSSIQEERRQHDVEMTRERASLGDSAQEPGSTPAPPRHPPPGFVGKALAASNASLDKRLADAEEQLAARNALLANGQTAVSVDPNRVRPSAFADRHPAAFEGPEFEEFLEEIKATGGNREPGIVRPVANDPNFDYELAAGHRRHRGTLKLGLPFFTFVRELSDEELLVSMSTENKGRKDLSSFERGRHFAILLNKGVFPSLRKLATALNEPFTTVQRLTTYGNLSDEVIGAFPDPRAIRRGWVGHLVTAFREEETLMRDEIDRLRREGVSAPAAIYTRLAGVKTDRSIVAAKDRILASVRMVHDRKAIVLYKDAPDELVQRITSLIEEYHREFPGGTSRAKDAAIP